MEKYFILINLISAKKFLQKNILTKINLIVQNAIGVFHRDVFVTILYLISCSRYFYCSGSAWEPFSKLTFHYYLRDCWPILIGIKSFPLLLSRNRLIACSTTKVGRDWWFEDDELEFVYRLNSHMSISDIPGVEKKWLKICDRKFIYRWN